MINSETLSVSSCTVGNPQNNRQKVIGHVVRELMSALLLRCPKDW